MKTSSTKAPKSASPSQPPSSSIPWASILREAQQRFGIERFRPGQREVIESVFMGRNTLALMPTGAGKSLTYQLPAMFLPKPVVVVSPLIALMQDQQEKAAYAAIAVEKLDSTLSAKEARTVAHEIEQGIAQLIYVTPERLQDREFLDSLNEAGGISLLVVDEAHTIAQWGHDFRPAFLSIGEARKILGDPPVLALTATATGEVITEILHSLRAEDAAIINQGTERQNLFFSVHPTVNNEAKLARISSLIEHEEGVGIIYTASVRSANELFEWLTDHGISVGHYHGRMKIKEREQVQAEFMRGEHKVMIATKAFGLGIDKPDIRFVYHFEFPDSLETYYQEAGRAGRDGDPAHAVLLYRLEDKRIQSFFLAGRYPSLAEMQAVYETMAGRVLAPANTALAASCEDLEEFLPEAAASSAGVDAVTLTKRSPASMAVPPPTLAELSGNQSSQEARLLLGPLSAAGQAAGARNVSALTIAGGAQVGQRRTQVILNLLREAGLIRLGRRGYVLGSTVAPPADVLESLLQTYVDRAARDKNRLAEMMHYAEALDCRTAIIRSYFGEAGGDPCLRCDNCAASGKVEHPALEKLQRAGKTHKEKRVKKGIVAPTHEEVTVIESMHGTIHTTAPSTLLTPTPQALFHPGDQVRHTRFGVGRVQDSHNDVVLVHFQKCGSKRLRADFLKAVA